MFGLFEIDFKKLFLVVLILALPLISLNLERRDTGTVKWYQQPVLLIVNPLQDFFSRFALGVSNTTSLYVDLINIKRDNRVLKEDLAAAKQEITQTEEFKRDYDRLKKLLEFKTSSASRLLGAQVVAVDLWGNSEYSSLKLNKGSDDGFKKGMGVITHEGVVGYLLNVTAHYSTVLVLTDRNAVVDALVARTRARGIVEGLGRDSCNIKYIQRTDDVQVGDLVVTGFDVIFPKGFPIGMVTKVVKKVYGVTQTVEMRPIVNVGRLEEVLVVAAPDVYPEKLKEQQNILPPNGAPALPGPPGAIPDLPGPVSGGPSGAAAAATGISP